MNTYTPTLAHSLAYDSECSIRDAAAILNSGYMKEVRDLLMQLLLRHMQFVAVDDLPAAIEDRFRLAPQTVRWLFGEKQKSYVPDQHPLGDVWSD